MNATKSIKAEYICGIEALLITSAILILWHLFRTAVIWTAVMVRCVPVSEVWFLSFSGQAPLAGAFASVFLLVFLWNGSVFVMSFRGVSNFSARIILALNAFALIGIAFAFVGLFKMGDFAYERDKGAFGDWLVLSSPFRVDECEAAKPFVGEWKISQSSESRFRVGGELILHRDLTFKLTPTPFVESYEGKWRPSTMVAGYIYADEFSLTVEFSLDGRSLEIVSPDWLEDQAVFIRLTKTAPSRDTDRSDSASIFGLVTTETPAQHSHAKTAESLPH